MSCNWCKNPTDKDKDFCSTECAFRMHNMLSARIKTLGSSPTRADKEILKSYRKELDKINNDYKGVFCRCQE